MKITSDMSVHAISSALSRLKCTLRGDGRYRCRYKGKDFYGDTEDESREKCFQFVLHQFKPDLADSNADCSEENNLKPVSLPTIRDYANSRWIDVYYPNIKLGTRKQYVANISAMAEYFGDVPMRSIMPMDCQAFLNAVAEQYSKSYVDKVYNLMRKVFRTATADQIIDRDPTTDRQIKKPKSKPPEGHRELEDWERKLVASTYKEHDFGPVAMLMMLAGLRRGEALYFDVDRDVDFDHSMLYVRGAVSFCNSEDGNQPTVSDGKNEFAIRTIQMSQLLSDVLREYRGKGLLCTKASGGLMTESAISKKVKSYNNFLSAKINGCQKRWYGATKEHKAMLTAGKKLPPWVNVDICCHDFRVTFCSMCYYAGIKEKTLIAWMGHSDEKMILEIYAKMSAKNEKNQAECLTDISQSYIFGVTVPD